MRSSRYFAVMFVAFAVAACTTADVETSIAESEAPVGPVADGGVVATTKQLVRPVGITTAFSGRPIDLVVDPSGRRVYIKESSGVFALDPRDGSAGPKLAFPGEGASMHGLAIAPDGLRMYATGAQNALFVIRADSAGKLALERTIALPEAEVGGASYPCGLTLFAGARKAVVCLSRDNAVALVDLDEGRVLSRVPVGVAPFDVAVSPDAGFAYVSNFGGRRAAQGEVTAKSSGTDILVDARGIGMSGTLSKVDLALGRVVSEIACGLHPCDLTLSNDGARLYVAAANSDAIYVVDTARMRIVEEVSVRPDPELPFGSITNALALAPDERTLYAANGGNNALAVVRLGDGASRASTLEGFIPTGWFPGAIATHANEIFVANVKGEGSREPKPGQTGWNSTRERGSVSVIPVPDPATLAAWTDRAKRDARVPQALRSAAARARRDVRAVPVPKHTGEPSTIEHVVYVIKENRTYDQVFGDEPRGNGDPSLCIFGREITPNHHALADRWVLLDNYFCNGVVSADGHQWATQGLVVDYLEKQFGGWTRSYDLGTDALTYAASGFLWDMALLHGLSFRNYGEFDFPEIKEPRGSWFDVWRARKDGSFRHEPSVSIAALARYTAPSYPGWHMSISDQQRMDRFLEEFRQMEVTGEFPNLVIVYLPQDHTSGTNENAPTPRACVADNDLALGRLIEALSRSRFWATTTVFVNEDDPQAGWDHVDGHRSLCLLAGPFVKRGAVVSRFYNQTSVLRTIELILGLPPMNQQDAGSVSMEDCFTNEPDLTPFEAHANRTPLDEPNPKKAALSIDSRPFVELSERQDLTLPDRVDDDAFNRVLWFAMRGSEPYPTRYAGAHGAGLERLDLKLGAPGEDEDD